jgi:hypothetical protein
VFSQGFAQHGNVRTEASLLNDGIGPHLLQLPSGDRATRSPSRNSIPLCASRRYEPNSYWLSEAIAEDPENFIRKVAEVPKDYQLQNK